MSSLPFLLVVMVGGGTAVLARGRPSVASGIVLGSLALALLAAIAIEPGRPLPIAGTALAPTAYGRVVLLLLTGTGLLLGLAALAGASVASAGPVAAGGVAMLGALAAVAVAVLAADALTATWVLAAGSVVGLGAGLLAHRGAAGSAPLGRGLRAVVIGAVLGTSGIALAVAATADGQGLEGTLEPTLGGVAFAAVVSGLAIRSAVVPFHGWAARIADELPRPALAPLLAWLPAAGVVVVLAWSDAAAAPLAAGLSVERGVLVALAIATLALGSLAAWIADDLGHAVAYVTITGAGVACFGIAAVDPASWAPTRSWVVVWAVSATGLVAWVAGLEGAYGTRRLPDLSGWARRSPILGVALVGLAIATVGLPGLAVATDRSALVAGAVDGPLAWLVRVLLFAPLVGLSRALVVGLRPVGGAVASGLSEWPRRVTDMQAGEAPAGDAPAAGLARAGAASLSRNRAPIASAAVLAICVVALASAAGGFGIGPAAAGGPAGAGGLHGDPGPGAEGAEPSVEPGSEPSPPTEVEPIIVP